MHQSIETLSPFKGFEELFACAKLMFTNFNECTLVIMQSEWLYYVNQKKQERTTDGRFSHTFLLLLVGYLNKVET